MGLEPIRLAAQEPKSCMSANSINSAGILPHQYSRFPLPCQSVWGGTAVSKIEILNSTLKSLGGIYFCTSRIYLCIYLWYDLSVLLTAVEGDTP